MDEFNLMMAFFGGFIVMAIIALLLAEIQFRMRTNRMHRENDEIDEMIALSGFVLGDCPNGENCPAIACQAARRAKA